MNSPIDNSELLRDFLNFESDDDFYFLQVMRRGKDNTDMNCNNVVLATHFVKSLSHFDKLLPEVFRMCDAFNARAYLNLNKRSFKKCALKSLELLAATIAKEEYCGAKKCFTSAAGSTRGNGEKLWVLDVDDDDVKALEHILETLKECAPFDCEKVKLKIPTKNGFHLITTPFNLHEFKTKLNFNLEVHKNNPTLLYAPCNSRLQT